MIFFEPLQFVVACPMGSKKVCYGSGACVDKHWNDIDCSVLKVDFKSVLNLDSRDAILEECIKHFQICLLVLLVVTALTLSVAPMRQLISQSGMKQETH